MTLCLITGLARLAGQDGAGVLGPGAAEGVRRPRPAGEAPQSRPRTRRACGGQHQFSSVRVEFVELMIRAESAMLCCAGQSLLPTRAQEGEKSSEECGLHFTTGLSAARTGSPLYTCTPHACAAPHCLLADINRKYQEYQRSQKEQNSRCLCILLHLKIINKYLVYGRDSSS